MVEQTLLRQLEQIFEVPKATYNEPGESMEQDTLFIRVDLTRGRVTDGRFKGRIEGQGVIYSQAEKLPLGYFAKMIAAHGDLTDGLFFYDIDMSKNMYENIVERSFSFRYLFNSQYDPEIGTITSATTEVEVTP